MLVSDNKLKYGLALLLCDVRNRLQLTLPVVLAPLMQETYARLLSVTLLLTLLVASMTDVIQRTKKALDNALT